MIRRAPRSSALFFFVVVAAVLTFVPRMTARSQAGSSKTVFVAVVDDSGKPVTDLTSADFRLREDNQDRDITDAKIATEPLSIALLADTSLTAGAPGSAAGAANVFRDVIAALTSFSDTIMAANPANQIELMEFGQAAIPVMPFTSSAADLDKAIKRLQPHPGAASVILEAVHAASNDLAKRPGARREIVSLNIEPSDEQSKDPTKDVFNSLTKSRASVWATALQVGALGNSARGTAMGPLAQGTGGRYDEILGQSTVAAQLKAVADILNSQYAVTYTRPASVKSATKVLLGVTRTGLKLYVSPFAPQ